MVTNRDIYNALGPRGLEKSDKKGRGGLANIQGTAFENEFAAFTILNWLKRCTSEGLDPEKIVLGFQVPGFVDDLYLRFPGGVIYYELKSSSTQTWTQPLRINFRRQLHVLHRSRKHAALVLMLASPGTAQVLRRLARFRLKRVNVGSYTPDRPKIRRRLYGLAQHSRTRADVDGLFLLLVGIWRETSRKRTLNSIIRRWNALSHGNILRIKPVFVAGAELLDGIPGMTFDYSSTRYVRFTHAGLMHGFIKYPAGSQEWARLIRHLRLANPQHYMDFFAAYSTFVKEETANDQ